VTRKRRSLIAFTFAAATAWLGVALIAQEAKPAEQKPADQNPAAGSIEDRLKELVPAIRAEKKLIGLAAMIMVDGKVIASAVDGERKKGSSVELKIGDRWHLGSITKSMTATMIGRVVEQKEIEWTTTVADCFGKTVELDALWRAVTLEQLLTHSSGAPPNFPITTLLNRPSGGEKLAKARRAAVAAVLTKKPKSQPGTSFAYSNVGFTIAAAMVEERTGKSWEELMRQQVFVPLKVSHAGFGPPKDNGKNLAQPRGHQNIGPFKRAMGENDDNTLIMAPAGGVHITLEELCAFGNEHLAGERGKGKLLKAETYKRLHTPNLSNYAFGWVVPDKTDWTEQKVIWHNGSNTLWYALIVLLPDRNAVVSVTSNDGDIQGAQTGAFQIAKAFADEL